MISSARTLWISVSLILLTQYLIILTGELQLGLAYDEVFHIPEAAALGTLGYKKLVTAHTPLGHWMAGLSLRLIQPVFDSAYYNSSQAEINELANRFLFSGVNNYKLTLHVARLPFMLMGVLTSLYVFLFSRSLWGDTAGFVSLLLCAFCSSLICWSRFVYMDGLLAFTVIATLAHTWWFLEGKSKKHLCASGFMLALACCSKYSGLTIVPWIVLVIAGATIYHTSPKNLTIKTLPLNFLIFSSVCIFTAWALFGFHPSRTFYFEGLWGMYSDILPDYRFYLMQKFKKGTWWYYFPICLFLKLSIAALFLLGASIYQFILELRKSKKLNIDICKIIFLLIPATMFTVATALKAIPAGARYVLPVHPIIYVLCGYGVIKLFQARSKIYSYIVYILILSHISRTILIYPDEMSYFNELIGGPNNGILWLNDTSIDAGQSLPRLAAYLRSRGNPKVRMLYQGRDRASLYGINSEIVSQKDWDGPPSSGLYVISANWLVYGQLETQERKEAHTDWLKTYPANIVKQFGGSIWVYEFK